MRRISLLLAFMWPSFAYAQGALKAVDCKYGENGEFKTSNEYRIYLLHQKFERYKYFDKQCTGKLTREEDEAYNKWVSDNSEIDDAIAAFKDEQRRGRNLPVPEQKKALKFVQKTQVANGNLYIGPILRDSFSDISTFAVSQDSNGELYIGKPASSASGATFAWNRDFVAPNSTWTAKGVAALPLIWQSLDAGDYPRVIGIAVSPTFTFNRLKNSNAKFTKNDVDVETYGGLTEFAIGGLPNSDFTQFVRVRSAYVSSFDGPSKAWELTAEWEPVVNVPSLMGPGIPHKLPIGPIMYELDTIARFEHNRRTSLTDTDPIFANGPTVDRAGGVVALSVQAEQGDTAPVPKWVQQFTYNATYSWLHNTINSKAYELFSTALSFSLDPDGHLAVKLSYDRGQVDETAQKIGVVKLGLAGKF